MRPVKKQLKKFANICSSNDEYKRQLANLQAATKSKEWEFVIQILWSIKNHMAIELLDDAKYTKSSPEDKDITQRVYHNINEWIDFLTNPTGWISKKGLLQRIVPDLKKVSERNAGKHSI